MKPSILLAAAGIVAVSGVWLQSGAAPVAAEASIKMPRGTVLFSTNACSDFGPGWGSYVNAQRRFILASSTAIPAGTAEGSNTIAAKNLPTDLTTEDLEPRPFSAAGGEWAAVYPDGVDNGTMRPLKVKGAEGAPFMPEYISLNACLYRGS